LDYGRSTAFSVSLEGITETEAAGIEKFARPTAIARMRQASRVLWGDILHVCHEE
jgi:hypothetical protein